MLKLFRQWLRRETANEERREEYITIDLIRSNAGTYADAVRWLRASLKSQGDFLRRQRDRAALWAHVAQVGVIVLGFVASLAAIFSKNQSPPALFFIWSSDDWSRLNILVPLILSALGSFLTFMDYRGRFVRNSVAFSVLSSVKADIDYVLLLGPTNGSGESNPGQPRITKTMVDAWNQRVNAAMSEHSADWERFMAGGGKK